MEKAPEPLLVYMLITGVLLITHFWKELQARRPGTLVEFFAIAKPHKRIEKSLAELEKSKEKQKSPVPRTRSRSPNLEVLRDAILGASQKYAVPKGNKA
uniref:Uncharacterized protein n=1 Tax=Cannabis sativa TaxID=3483 RepID=A0A803NJ71_CANSA